MGCEYKVLVQSVGTRSILNLAPIIIRNDTFGRVLSDDGYYYLKCAKRPELWNKVVELVESAGKFEIYDGSIVKRIDTQLLSFSLDLFVVVMIQINDLFKEETVR